MRSQFAGNISYNRFTAQNYSFSAPYAHFFFIIAAYNSTVSSKIPTCTAASGTVTTILSTYNAYMKLGVFEITCTVGTTISGNHSGNADLDYCASLELS